MIGNFSLTVLDIFFYFVLVIFLHKRYKDMSVTSFHQFWEMSIYDKARVMSVLSKKSVFSMIERLFSSLFLPFKLYIFALFEECQLYGFSPSFFYLNGNRGNTFTLLNTDFMCIEQLKRALSELLSKLSQPESADYYRENSCSPPGQ